MKRAFLPLAVVGILAGSVRANEASSAAYLDGLDLLSTGHYGDAAKAFGKAIDEEEGNPGYYQARGVARTLAEDFTGALKDLEVARKLAPARDWETAGWIGIASKMNGHPEVGFAPGTAPRPEQPYAIALSDMGQNYWSTRNGGQYFDKAQGKMVQSSGPYKGDFAKVAADYVRKHEGLSDASRKVILQRIQAKIAAGDYLDAIDRLGPMLAANPGDVELLTARARALLALGNWPGARRVYTEILTRQPSATAYIDRARAAAHLGDAARVTKDVAEARRMDPAAAMARQEIEKILAENLAQRDPGKIWQRLEKESQSGAPAAQLCDTAVALIKAMGAVRIRYDENYQGRLCDLETQLAAHPNDPAAQINLGRFLHNQAGVLGEQVGPRAAPQPYRLQTPQDLKQELGRAEELVNTALKEHPHNLAALTFKAHLLVDAQQYDEATRYVIEALKLNGDDPDLMELLAGLLQIDAAVKVSQAGNLKQPRRWYETDFAQYPPVEYIFTRMPTQEELDRAAALEQQSRDLMTLAEEHIAAAAAKAGATALGFYYQGTLQRIRTDLQAARESMTKAVALQPDFVQAWFQLAGICTQLGDGDAAIAARAKAYNLSDTTAAAELNALWYKIPRAQFKSARETVAAGLAIDPADPRLPAYLAVIDEATAKPGEAMAHYRMAAAIGDADLVLQGTRFGAPEKGHLLVTGENSAVEAAVRLRIGMLLLDQGKPAEAAEQFASVRTAMAILVEGGWQGPLTGGMLPNPDLPAGAVPLADTADSLRVRAADGESYAAWAATAKSPESTALAAKTYRRLFITYTMTAENLDSLKAIGDLGMAELYLSRGQIGEAAASMKGTPAVPQDFWQEMRQTEAAIIAHQRGR